MDVVKIAGCSPAANHCDSQTVARPGKSTSNKCILRYSQSRLPSSAKVKLVLNVRPLATSRSAMLPAIRTIRCRVGELAEQPARRTGNRFGLGDDRRESPKAIE